MWRKLYVCEQRKFPKWEWHPYAEHIVIQEHLDLLYSHRCVVPKVGVLGFSDVERCKHRTRSRYWRWLQRCLLKLSINDLCTDLKIELCHVFKFVVDYVIEISMLLYAELYTETQSAVVPTFGSKRETSPPYVDFNVKLLIKAIYFRDLGESVCY